MGGEKSKLMLSQPSIAGTGAELGNNDLGTILFSHRPRLYPEVEKGVEHGSIAPRRIWTEAFLAEGFWPSLPHSSRFL